MTGYAKIWTDVLHDDWFIKMNSTGRNLWLHLILYAKDTGDTGVVCWRSTAAIAAACGCNADSARKYVRFFGETKRIELKEEKNCITIKILNYQYYQELNAKEHIQNRRQPNEKRGKNRALPEQSRAEQSRAEQTIYSEVVSDLNLKTGKKYRPDTPDTIKLIKNLLDIGYTLSDFQHVHTIKAKQWRGDPKMDKFLRPSTLYQPAKFAGYLNETEVNLSLTETARLNANAVAQAKTELFGEPKPVEYEVLPNGKQ